ncbi:MAG: hypothetical protein A2511_09020 [Deltaproteobacteria bacterium RIFOXYD12_FULL_50_9]|nr:MAG: hypothetical protein A2511_09020 [Deltaproteobacteria bacterium RIFOXYD12_FULL_50_9]
MQNNIDLHIHSTFSDGTLTPSSLVAMARRQGLAAISLTDHDTMAGIPEAIAAGRSETIEVIPGIELSALHKKASLHILGYGLDHRNAELIAKLNRYQEARRERNEKIIEKLARLGIRISLDDLRQSTNGQIGRPHFARELVRLGVVRSEEAAFIRFLRTGGKAFVETFRYSAETTIAMINAAGGIAVLAHPATLNSSLSTIPTLLKELVPLGLKGIEVYYPRHTPKVTHRLAKLAENFGLLITGGSDFHGRSPHLLTATPDELAMTVPGHLLTMLKKSLERN